MTKRFEQFLARMRSSRLRATEPRKAILKFLASDHGPFTAEQTHSHVAKSGCDIATVYRALTSLEQAGMVRRCEFGDGMARYELVEGTDHHHHHVICKACKKIEVLADCNLDDIDRFAKKLGFAEVSHSLEFFGMCPKCK